MAEKFKLNSTFIGPDGHLYIVYQIDEGGSEGPTIHCRRALWQDQNEENHKPTDTKKQPA